MIIGSKVILRSKNIADASDDYTWQIDSELAYLDATSQLKITFHRYLSDYIQQLQSPLATRRQFGIDTLDGKHIGNCVYYGINKIKREAELGIMIGHRDYWSKGYGTDAVTALIDYIFHQTRLKRIYLKTLESNSRAQKCFQKCGFTSYGHRSCNGFNFVLMETYRKQWEEKQTEAPVF